MEMTLESLVASGLTNDQAKAVLEAHKASITGDYIPKARFDEVNTQLANANSQLKGRDEQIASLKKFEGDNTALQAKIAELQEASKTKDAEMQAALTKERLSNAMKMQLTGKVHDVDMVLSQIASDKVSIDASGNLVGFEDQVKNLKESKKFLFVEEAPQKSNPYAGFKVVGQTPPDGGNTPPAEQNTPEAFGVGLAKRKLASADAAKKAQEHYFKGGN